MSDSAPEMEREAAKPKATVEQRDFCDVLKSLLGKLVTIVNPESYEDAPLGHDIRKGWYPAKPVGLGNDYLILATEYKHTAKKEAMKEPVKQFIPFSQIKRISVMKNEVLIHL